MGVTIRDVARVAGVSVQTVSNVLNNNTSGMRKETRGRVLQAMAELGYTPNVNARSLRQNRSYAIAFSALDPSPGFLQDPFHSEVVTGISQVALVSGYCLIIHLAEAGPNLPSLPTLHEQRRIDGAVVSLSGSDRQRRSQVRKLEQAKMPFVLIEDKVRGAYAASVRGENRLGAHEAVTMLLKSGRRRVVFIRGDVVWPAAAERERGYLAALEDAGLADRQLILTCPWNAEGARKVVTEFLEHQPDVDAMFCANDQLAAGALQALRALGRRIPDDIGVVGFDDFEFAAFLEPPLTTVRLPGRAMGERAAHMLLDYMRNGHFSERDVVFPAVLTMRTSH